MSFGRVASKGSVRTSLGPPGVITPVRVRFSLAHLSCLSEPRRGVREHVASAEVDVQPLPDGGGGVWLGAVTDHARSVSSKLLEDMAEVAFSDIVPIGLCGTSVATVRCGALNGLSAPASMIWAVPVM